MSSEKQASEKPAKKVDAVTLPVNEKVEKRFQNAFGSLIAFAGGRQNLKKAKVANASIASLVDEVFKARREKVEEQFKTGVGELFEDYEKFVTETDKAWNAFVSEVTKSKEAFAERAEKLLVLVQDANAHRIDFVKNLSDLSKKGDSQSNVAATLGSVNPAASDDNGSAGSDNESEETPS
jgi:hypothetical protein